MYRYFIKTPWWIKKFFSSYVWAMPVKGKEVFLTFDDGPHPTITPWVLDELKKYDAKATFFCIGNNVANHANVYNRIIENGHAVGNHTQHHLNGWKTSRDIYLKDVELASNMIASDLFRPPYGRIKTSQSKGLNAAMKTKGAKVIMWDVLSGDFDRNLSPQQCLQNVLKNVSAGSIIVFHDSEKAADNLQYALPVVMEILSCEGYRFEKIVVGRS
ncbi:MAG: polysaccharide deacetylase family protein [Bacteroidota bacterium]|nr:polysaccharide deacetylase family protein [Bacteroidota bacterium]